MCAVKNWRGNEDEWIKKIEQAKKEKKTTKNGRSNTFMYRFVENWPFAKILKQTSAWPPPVRPCTLTSFFFALKFKKKKKPSSKPSLPVYKDMKSVIVCSQNEIEMWKREQEKETLWVNQQ